MTSIQQRMAGGIVWMVFARLVDRGIGVVSTLILARLLVPEDFGLVAMATAIGAVLDLLGAFNFDLALIQNKEASRSHYDTVWTFNVLFGLFCGVTLAALAIPASIFYREPRLEIVMYVLALPYAISGFSNIGVVNFRKDLHFRDEFKFIIWRRVVTFCVTVGCAFWLRSYWALIIGMIVGRLASVAISFQMSRYRPSVTLVAWRELFHFSKWLFINNSLYFLLHSGPNFVIGRMNGALGLGVYSVAYEISNLPSSELVAPINRATFPGFAKMVDSDEIAYSYLKLLGMITLLILPIGVGIAAVAEPLVLTALGPKWTDAIELIQLLAVYGAIAATQTNNGVIWMAVGRPRDLTYSTLLFLSILFPALYVFLGSHEVLGAGYAYLIAQSAITPVALWNTGRLVGIRWAMFASVVWRPLAGVALMYWAVTAFDELQVVIAPWSRLLLDALVGTVLYSVAILLLWLISGRPSGAESYCLQRVGLAGACRS